jgi:acylaminoacyl-peptidase
MTKPIFRLLIGALLTLSNSTAMHAAVNNSKTLQLSEVFELEFVTDPQISADGSQVVYVRNFLDIMQDRKLSNLWIINTDDKDHRPLTSGNVSHSSPRWSPDGKRLLYVADEDGSSQLYSRWMDTGQSVKLSNLIESPGNIAWSPDGKWIAFTMFVPQEQKPFAKMPTPPEGAEWAEPVKYIDRLIYRSDGEGLLEHGYTHVFVLPAEGGTPRQLTSGDFDHNSQLSWSQDGKALIFSANRLDNWEFHPENSDIFEVLVADGSITQLTNQYGPNNSPAVSPNGKRIAYLGYEDQRRIYEVTELYVMDRDGNNAKLISADLDRSVMAPVWSQNGKRIFFLYHDRGNTKLASMDLKGKVEVHAENVGGTSLDRPFPSGSFSLAQNDDFAFTESRPDYPADLAIGSKRKQAARITQLNKDLFEHKQLATLEEIWYKSSADNRDIQGWIVKPADFDPTKKYPLILEIHGGPVGNYGDRFAPEFQLYAAAGYVVLYTNPRGSNSYGEEFSNLIHHNYPGEDYDDLISGVDAVIARGYIDDNNLFVTGGSGGGVLSSWIIGKTDRFSAAVVVNPVINWTSFVLTSDGYNYFYKYWFPGPPWEQQEQYWKRSPLSLVGNVTTPTMLLTGEADHRTPIAETEQYYQALKLRGVDAAMVRVPGATHNITTRPSNLIGRVANVLAWFEKYRNSDTGKESMN